MIFPNQFFPGQFFEKSKSYDDQNKKYHAKSCFEDRTPCQFRNRFSSDLIQIDQRNIWYAVRNDIQECEDQIIIKINNPKIPKEKKEHDTRAMYLLYSDSAFFFPNVFNNISWYSLIFLKNKDFFNSLSKISSNFKS